MASVNNVTIAALHYEAFKYLAETWPEGTLAQAEQVLLQVSYELAMTQMSDMLIRDRAKSVVNAVLDAANSLERSP